MKPAVLFIVPLLMFIFVWMSVTHWITAKAAERKMRERYALFKHLSERPAEGAQLVLEQLRQDDAREEERERAKTITVRRGKLEGGVIVIVVGVALTWFLRMLAPAQPVWLIGLMPLLVGVVLFVSGWLEKPKGER